MSLIATPSLTDRFSLILDGLYRAVAARIAGGAMLAAMIVLVCTRVRRVEGQILRLLALYRSGKLRFRTSVAGRGGGGSRGKVSAGLPRGFGWLLPLVPCHAAGYGSQLRHFLDDPEMKALVEVCPQARRVLAPLCRMLGLEPEVLGMTSVPRVVREKVKRVRKPRPKIDWGRIPLPRGVLTAARRQGFGKMPRE